MVLNPRSGPVSTGGNEEHIPRRRFLGMSLGCVTAGVTVKMGGKKPDEAGKERARLRDLGIVIGRFEPGRYNAITDVTGLKVGHCTKIAGSGELRVGYGPVRTGVTAILPRGGEEFVQKCAAGLYILNGNGEMTGYFRIRETGILETPIYLTGTANIGIVYDAALTQLFRQNPNIGLSEHVPVPVVAECWDGMGDTQGRHISEADVLDAVRIASDGPVDEGAVGGGTGMRCYGFKAGIGTSSRILPQNRGGYTVGVMVNANHGSRHLLRVDGVPVGRALKDYPDKKEAKTKSIILIAATDAPLLPIQLQRLCKRMSLGLARTGSVSTHGSGDILLALSTANVFDSNLDRIRMMDDRLVSLLWEATVEATEEAVLNALTAAPSLDGVGGRVRHSIPLDRLQDLMEQHGRSIRYEQP